MPIYEFRCEECGHEFEDFQHVNSENPKCPVCQKQVQKLMSLFSGVVKGSEHRSIDCIVGEDADKRRGYLENRKKVRKIQQ
jgi:putative FmdB family regulatory protein